MSELAVGSLSGLAANSYVIDVASGSKLRQPGAIIAVKDVLKTDTFSASVASGGNVAVTDLSITHEVENPSNRLIISAFFGSAANSSGFALVGLALHDGTGFIAVGDSSGSRSSISSSGLAPSANTVETSTPSVTFVHTPGAGSKTYTMRAVNMSSNTQTVYINRNELDDDSAAGPRSVSGLVIQEVAG